MKHEFFIYDEIQADGVKYDYEQRNYVNFKSETSASFFADKFKAVKPGEEVHLFINSMGGSVKEALGICSLLRRSGAKTVAHVDGYACSAASLIAAACDTVVMPRNTAQMIHNARGHIYGTSAEMRKAAHDLDIINGAAMQTYLMKGREKLPPEVLVDMLGAETWLDAESCMRYGLCDELGEQDADIEAAAKAFRKALESAKAQGNVQEWQNNPPAAIAEELAKMEAQEGAGAAESAPNEGQKWARDLMAELEEKVSPMRKLLASMTQ